MQKKIIFVTPSIKTGGGNRVFIELANQLCGNHNINIVYPNNSTENNTFEKNEKVKYIAIGSFSEYKVKKIWNMLCCIFFLNKNYSDAKIIISDPIFCLFLPLLTNKNTFRFIQADDYRIYDDGKILGNGMALRIYKWLCLKIYRYKISYIFNSRFVYEHFCLDAKRNDVPYSIVYPAINHLIFKSVKKELRHRISICLVARKHPWKGLDTFINMYRHLSFEVKSKISIVTLISVFF